MQTFLPYDDFILSAKVLDYKRLGKQRVETLQILSALTTNTGWNKHPAAVMWKGHTNALVQYGIDICNEWISRGYRDTCLDKIKAYHDSSCGLILPPWFGLNEFHASHRSNLIRKYPDYYSVYFEEDNSLPYCWPICIDGKWILRFKHAGIVGYLNQKIMS